MKTMCFSLGRYKYDIYEILMKKYSILQQTYRMVHLLIGIWVMDDVWQWNIKWSYSLEESWEMLKTFFKSKKSSTHTVKTWKKEIRKGNVPKTLFMDDFVKRVRKTGLLMAKTTWERSRLVCSTENSAAEAKSVYVNNFQHRQRLQQLHMSHTFRI